MVEVVAERRVQGKNSREKSKFEKVFWLLLIASAHEDTRSVNDEDTGSVNDEDTGSVNDEDAGSVNDEDAGSVNDEDTLWHGSRGDLNRWVGQREMPKCAE